jgi:hypothetical protein
MPTFSNTPRPAYVYEAATDQWIPVGFGPHTHAVTDVTNAFNTTTVTAKGDLVVAAGSNNVTRLPAGSNGQSLVADSTTTTGLRYQHSVTSGKNCLINGAFDIWQRGTSIAFGNVYSADRWSVYHSSATATATRQLTNDTTNLPNIQYCIRLQRNSSSTATDPIYLLQSVETVNSIPFAGKTVTVSFYARAGANFSAPSSVINVRLQSGTSVDGSIVNGPFDNNTGVINADATLTTTWQQFTFTATVPVTTKQLGFYTQHNSVGTAGVNDYYEITGIQLELGSVATHFSRAGGTIGGELSLCQRYYERINWNSLAGYATFGQGAAQTTLNVRTLVPFLVQKRVKPTAIDYPTVSTNFRIIDFADNVPGSATAVAFDGNQTSTSVGYLNWTTTGAVQNRPYLVTGNNTASAYLGWSAEL